MTSRRNLAVSKPCQLYTLDTYRKVHRTGPRPALPARIAWHPLSPPPPAWRRPTPSSRSSTQARSTSSCRPRAASRPSQRGRTRASSARGGLVYRLSRRGIRRFWVRRASSLLLVHLTNDDPRRETGVRRRAVVPRVPLRKRRQAARAHCAPLPPSAHSHRGVPPPARLKANLNSDDPGRRPPSSNERRHAAHGVHRRPAHCPAERVRAERWGGGRAAPHAEPHPHHPWQ